MGGLSWPLVVVCRIAIAIAWRECRVSASFIPWTHLYREDKTYSAPIRGKFHCPASTRDGRTGRRQPRQLHPPFAQSQANEQPGDGAMDTSSTSIGLEIVLFGVGDLRTDDHRGLERALRCVGSGERGKVLPLFVLNDATVVNLPGANAHTLDTANLLSSALQDLDSSLREQFGASLHVYSKQRSSGILTSLSGAISDYRASHPEHVIAAEHVRVHVCDMGDVDNRMKYGAYGQLLEELKDDYERVSGMEIVPWREELRTEPWERVEKLPDDYPTYEKKFVQGKPPPEPTGAMDLADSIDPSKVVSIESMKQIPSAEDTATRMMEPLRLDAARCRSETNTGLYASHWGGLDPASIGCSAVLETVDAYLECEARDELWVKHPAYVGRRCRRNGNSLEHSAMAWQLRGDGKAPAGRPENLLVGESMTRYLAAPLLYGTVSSRRLWHLVEAQEPVQNGLLSALFPGTIPSNPLKLLVEGREWHKLLAARNLRTEPAYQQDSDRLQRRYHYWRWNGFLCRYVETAGESSTTAAAAAAEREGILLVHGFGASGDQWNKAMNEIYQRTGDKDRFHGLAPDLIGFGQSEKPGISYTGYMWDSMVMDLVKERAIPLHKWTLYVVGGNSIGGFTSMCLAACDAATASEEGRQVSSTGAPGTSRCTGLVLMNSAGPVKTRDEIEAETAQKQQELGSVAQVTALDALPPCKPPPRPVARAFGNVLLAYLRPQIQPICKNLYPTNPEAVDDDLCRGILRDSLDVGAVNVMMSGAKLPPPRTANELLMADFGGPPTPGSQQGVLEESSWTGPVLIAQGVLDPLNNSTDRMLRFGALRDGITCDPIRAGHCPHDELPDRVGESIVRWMSATRGERRARVASFGKLGMSA